MDDFKDKIVDFIANLIFKLLVFMLVTVGIISFLMMFYFCVTRFIFVITNLLAGRIV